MNLRDHLSRLSLREKCAQKIVCDFRFAEPDYERVVHLVRKVGLGGVRLRGGSLFDVAPLANSLQRVAKLPLLVAADYENGAGEQVSGATVFPSAMAIGATGSEELAQAKGRLTAREAGAMGVRWILAPGADADPAAGTRSFGADPALVVRLARAFLAGLREMKAIGCLTFRFGPFVDVDPDAEAVMGAPPGPERAGLRAADAAGMDPEAIERAALAGADVLLCPGDPEKAVDVLERAVTEGRLTDAAVYRSVERILGAKQRLGLFGERIADQSVVEQRVGAASHRAAAERMAEQAVTLVRGSGRLPGAVSFLALGEAPVFERELRARVRVEEGAETCVAAVTTLDEAAAGRLRERASRHPGLVVVALGSPFGLSSVPGEAVAAYGADEASQRAAARALAGEIPFAGKLPVNLGS